MTDNILKNNNRDIGIGKVIGKPSENIGIPSNSDAFRFTNSDRRNSNFIILSDSSKVFQSIAFYHTFIMEKGRGSETYSAERKKIYRSDPRNRKVSEFVGIPMVSDGFPIASAIPTPGILIL